MSVDTKSYESRIERAEEDVVKCLERHDYDGLLSTVGLLIALRAGLDEAEYQEGR